jgi:glycosyltransferase involved in cell wall biosynthesis
MISIVTGTLNRIDHLKRVIENTVDSDSRLELVLIDGGSIDGTIEYLKNLNHSRVKLIEEGGRSYYWDYMKIGRAHV